MKLLSLILLTLAVHLSVHAQDYKFPDDWLGQYEGSMFIDTKNHTRDTIDVDFGLTEMIKDSLWAYKMVFHTKDHGMILKDYLIHAKKKGDSINFILDQKNRVEIELTLMNNCLYSAYRLDDVIYSSMLKRLVEGILFEIFTVNALDPNYSVLRFDEENQLNIESYFPQVVQSALLKPRK